MSAKKNQQGIVSIIVTMILMVVITLVVLAFGTLSRREQRAAADRQLSTQAFYAAESGVNQAKTTLNTWLASANPTERAKADTDYTSNCTDFLLTANGSTNPVTIGAAGANSSYTCLFVKTKVPEFRYSATDASIAFPFRPEGAIADNLKISWDNADTTTNFASCPTAGSNPPTSSCSATPIRVEITNTSLSASTVYFIYPTGGGFTSTLAYFNPPHAAVPVTVTGCSGTATPQKCSVIIAGVPNGSYVRIKGIYSKIALTAVANSGRELLGGQAIIDATGKTADVERRIQVRVSISALPGDAPTYGLQATDKICKKFGISSSSDTPAATDPGGCWGGAAAPN